MTRVKNPTRWFTLSLSVRAAVSPRGRRLSSFPGVDAVATDELDTHRRLCRKLLTDLRSLGFGADELRGRSLVELDELRARRLLELAEGERAG